MAINSKVYIPKLTEQREILNILKSGNVDLMNPLFDSLRVLFKIYLSNSNGYSGEYQRVQNLFKNKRISLEELNKSPFYVDMVSQAVMKQLKRYYFEYQHGFDYICDDYFWSFSPNDCVELFKDDNLGTVLKSEQIRESLKPMLKEYLLNRGEKYLPESVELRVVNKEQTPRTITMLLAEFKEDNS